MERELVAVPVVAKARGGCVDRYGKPPHSQGCVRANRPVFSGGARFGIPAWSRLAGDRLLAGSAETTSGRSGRVSSGLWTWLSIVIGLCLGELGKTVTYFVEKYLGTGDGWHYPWIVSNVPPKNSGPISRRMDAKTNQARCISVARVIFDKQGWVTLR